MAERDLGEGLVRAAAGMLRPVVRQLVASGMPFGRLEAHLRRLFVEVAEREFALPGRRQTDSRISLLTGINRKEVRRMRSAATREAAPGSFSRNLAANLVSLWMADPRATDRSGRPLPLPYRARTGPSFMRLARRATVDLPPRAILDELLRTGAAEERDDGKIALVADSYVPRLGRGEQLDMLAEDPAELVDTMIRNILSTGERRLQRKVFYDNIGSQGAKRVRQQMRREGERFLRKVNLLLAKHDRDRNPKAAGGDRLYAGIGVYYFEAPGSERRSGRRERR